MANLIALSRNFAIFVSELFDEMQSVAVQRSCMVAKSYIQNANFYRFA